MKYFWVAIAMVLASCVSTTGPSGYYDSATDPVVAAATSYELKAQQKVEVQRRVSRLMKDPSSAQFEEIRAFQRDGIVTVCGSVNARNGYGGYVGFGPFVADMDPTTNAVTNVVVPDNDNYAQQDFIRRRCAV
jgi:hypothetical protein